MKKMPLPPDDGRRGADYIKGDAFERGAVIAVLFTVIMVSAFIVIFSLSGCRHTAPSPGPYDPCHWNCVEISNKCQHDVHYCNREFEMCMNDCSE